VSDSPNSETLAVIDGHLLRVVVAALDSFAQQNLDLDLYRIEVVRMPDQLSAESGDVVVSFVDRNAPPVPWRTRGNPGGIPGFEVGLDSTDLRVIRAAFIR
jgi:hypothetical protein